MLPTKMQSPNSTDHLVHAASFPRPHANTHTYTHTHIHTHPYIMMHSHVSIYMELTYVRVRLLAGFVAAMLLPALLLLKNAFLFQFISTDSTSTTRTKTSIPIS
jgi:hypothetical protein